MNEQGLMHSFPHSMESVSGARLVNIKRRD